MRRRALASFVPCASIIILAGCGDGGTPGGPPRCPTAYDVLQGDADGTDLVSAQHAHVPSDAEMKETAFMWAVAIAAAANVDVDPVIETALAAARSDPAQASLFGAQVPGLYPAYFAGCPATTAPATERVGAVSQAIIHVPFECSDDCRITVQDLLDYYDVYDSILEKLAGALGGDVASLLAQVRPGVEQGMSLEDAVAQYEDETGAYKIAIAAGDAVVKASAISGAVTATAGAEVPAAVFEAIAAFVSLPLVAAKTMALANLIDGCRAFKADPRNGCGVSMVTGSATYPNWDGATVTISFQATAQPDSPGGGAGQILAGSARLTWQGISSTATEQQSCSDETLVTCTTSEKAPPLMATTPISGHVAPNPDGTLDLGLEAVPSSATVQDVYVEQCPCDFGSWGTTETRTTTYTPFELVGLCAGGNGWTLTAGKYDKTWSTSHGNGQCHIQVQ